MIRSRTRAAAPCPGFPKRAAYILSSVVQIDRSISSRRAGVGRFGAAAMLICSVYFRSLSDGCRVGYHAAQCVGGFRCSSNGLTAIHCPLWRLGFHGSTSDTSTSNNSPVLFPWSGGFVPFFPATQQGALRCDEPKGKRKHANP